MAVEIYEQVKAWIEFPGETYSYFEHRRSETYIMTINMVGRNEVCFFQFEDDDDVPYNDTEDAALEIRASIFAGAIRRLGAGATSFSLGKSGRFDIEEGEVKYTTDCGEHHFFDLEDLLVLVDIIEDTAVIEPIT